MRLPVLHLAWRNLFRNTRRTLVSLATVGFGSGGLLIFQGFNHGIMNQYRENTIRGIYSHGQIMKKGYYDRAHEDPFAHWVDQPEEIERSLKVLDYVQNLFPRQSFYAFVMLQQKSLAARGEGVLPERENSFFTELNFIEGSNLQGQGQLILGKGLAEALGIKVGDNITLLANTAQGQINGIDLEVVGIFHTGIKAFDDQNFRLHLADAQKLLNFTKIEKWGVQLKDHTYWPLLTKQITQNFTELEAISFEDLDATYYKNSVAFLDRQFQVIRLIILIIVGLGIFNMIGMALLERSHEFGVLLSNGESNWRLSRIVLTEAILLGLIGSALGVLVAILLDRLFLKNGIPMPPGPGVTRQFLVYLEFSGNHFISAMIFPTLSAMVAAIQPCHRILFRPIAQLLRYS